MNTVHHEMNATQDKTSVSNAPVNNFTYAHTSVPAHCVYCGGELHTFYQPALYEGARGADFVTCMRAIGDCPMAGMTIGAANYHNLTNLARYLTPDQLAEIEARS